MVPQFCLTTRTEVSYSITDGRGVIATASVAVSIGPVKFENHVLKIRRESVSVNENTPVKVVLKARDADDGDHLIFIIVKEPSHGKIAEFSGSEGTLIYLPDRDYEWKDSFKFKVNDRIADSKDSKISIQAW